MPDAANTVEPLATTSSAANSLQPVAERRWTRRTWSGVLALLAIHSGLLAWLGATCSPTYDEPAHLAAGYRIWTTGQIDLYTVNPPLVKTVAAVPLLWLEPKADWSFVASPVGSRPEFMIGRRFLVDNRLQWRQMMTWSRWAVIPLSLIGAVVAFQWAREAFGTWAGWTALTLWTVDPNLLGNGCLITPDVGGSSLGLLAAYTFTKWLAAPSGRLAVAASGTLALALLSKGTFLILGPLWVMLWMVDRWVTGQWRDRWRKEWGPLLLILLGSVYGLNLGYGFQGTGTPLGEYQFLSQTLAGELPPGTIIGNRFRQTVLGRLPVPLPREYVQGLDLQKKDFDDGRWSFLAGEWRWGGWWHFYLVAIAIKSPLGYGVLLVIALATIGRSNAQQRLQGLAIGLPLVAIVAFVTREQGFTSFVRYVLPALPFGIVLMAAAGERLRTGPSWVRAITVLTLGWVVGSSLLVWPHSLSYFNESVGGPQNGYRYLVDANLDWGQDLHRVADWIEKHPHARPLTLAWHDIFDTALVGLKLPRTPLASPQRRNPMTADAPNPYEGWHVLGATVLQTADQRYAFFQELTPVDRIGYSTMVYYVSPELAAAWGRRLQPTPEVHHAP